MQPTNILDDFDSEGNELPNWAKDGEVVAKFFSAMEAEVAAARLRAEGVHCFLANSTSQSVLPHLQTVLRLHVRPNDSAIAREILQEAAIENIEPGRRDSGRGAVIVMAVIIGLLLSWLLVQALSL
ncbi:MAG: DUF2007 domain-containing protein [Saprospiraceae bacterium]|nr:DUF2007 domain-containing protein [Saprospiraceae bacterium]MCB9342423.1 DUF2007 domain-containing protein [Lewinellaceae bacterium]